MKLYIVQRPNIEESTIIQFLEDEGFTWKRTESATPADELIELSGRICYLSFGNKQSPRTNNEYISNLISAGHESVLEHISWSFIITGVTRAFSHQLVRHRIGFSFSQLSQQYYNEENLTLIPPKGHEVDSWLMDEWKNLEETIQDSYIKIRDQARESAPSSLNHKERNRWINSTARSILPNCTETKLSVTANARAIRDLLAKRGVIQGDLEMREFAAILLTNVKQDAPSTFSDFNIATAEDGFPIVTSGRK